MLYWLSSKFSLYKTKWKLGAIRFISQKISRLHYLQIFFTFSLMFILKLLLCTTELLIKKSSTCFFIFLKLKIDLSVTHHNNVRLTFYHLFGDITLLQWVGVGSEGGQLFWSQLLLTFIIQFSFTLLLYSDKNITLLVL